MQSKSTILIILISFLLITQTISAQNLKIKKGKNNKYGIIDSYDNQLVGFKYDMINKFYENKAAVLKRNKWGFIDTSGKLIIKCKYSDVFYFSQNLCPVLKKDSWIFIDSKGDKIIEREFQHAFPFTEGFAPIKMNNKWGFINKKGDFMILPKFQSIGNFSEGLAAVKHNNLWGYMNKEGRIVIDFKFDIAYQFKNGQAKTMVNGSIIFIDKNGDFIKAEQEKDNEEKLYSSADTMPQFPGGNQNLFKYINKNLKYPQKELEEELEGIVWMFFTVDSEGNIKDVKILDGLTGSCDLEAMRVIKEMPKWTPGIHNGKNVNVRMKIKIKFSLDKN